MSDIVVSTGHTVFKTPLVIQPKPKHKFGLGWLKSFLRRLSW